MKSLFRQSMFFAVILVCSFAAAQVSTGKQPLGSFSGGLDLINLGNLNVHFEVPIIHKPGRGLPFDYIYSMDNSIWTPVSVNGTVSWQPVANWGWRAITEASVGYISFSSATLQCIDPETGRRFHVIQRYDFKYHDQFGTIHNFANLVGGCPGDYDPSDSVSTDDSGYTLHTGGGPGTITAPDGTIINPPVGGYTGNGNRIDRNGNEITTNGSSFTDTLGLTVLSTSGGVPNPLVFTYTTSSGTPASITINYSPYTVRTNFACSGVSEYTAPTSLISSIVFPDNSQYTFTYEPTPGFPGNVTGRIQSINLRTGGTITYAYTGNNNGIVCADGSAAGLTRTLSHGGTTDAVTTYARSGAGTAWTTTITDGTTPTGNQEVINFQKSGVMFFETHRSVYQGSSNNNNVLIQTDTCYNAAAPSCSNTAITLPIVQVDRYVTLNNNQQSLITAFLGTFGLPGEVDEYDYGTPTHGSLLRKTLITYASLGNGIVDFPYLVVVQDGSGNPKSWTNYNYDETAPSVTSGVPQHIAITGSRGNLTSITRWLDLPSPKNVISRFTYDDTGNVLTSTDPGNHQTAFGYADNFSDGINRSSLAYLTQITMPDTHSPNLAHHITQTQYEPNTGLAAKTIDQNGQQTTFSYDALGRPLQANYPDGGQATASYPSTTQIVVQNKIDATRLTNSNTILDSFGRLSRSARANGESLQYDLQDSCYDANGRLRFQSYPYQAGSLTGAQVCSGAGDSFAYDGAGRLTTATHSDSSTIQYTYSGRAQQTSDEGNGSFNVKRIQQSDALGRLTAVCELYSSSPLFGNGGTPLACGLDLAGSGFTTSYAYDALNRLTAIAQGGLPPRTFAYDSLSRMLSESHPEWTSVTSNPGNTVFYSYNDDGLMTQRVRPKANQTSATVTTTTTYAYDELHRSRAITYNDGTQSSTLNYDEAAPFSIAATNTIGRLSSEVAGTGSTAKSVFSYDVMGRVLSNWQCTPQFCPSSTFKQFSYSYDLAGDTISAGNGVGVTFGYTYNIAPRITGMTSSLVDASHPATLLSNVLYGVYGPNVDLLGNSIQENFGYNAYGAVSSYLTTPARYSFSLTFAPNWNVATANDSVNGNWAYGYDEFNHLASSNKNSGAQTFTYKYDRYGNRWQQNAPQGGPAPQYTFDTNNHISGSGITYDALGNILNDGLGNTYTYDAENRVNQVANGNGNYAYAYDAEGRRVKSSSSPSVGQEFLYDLAGRAVTIFNLSGIWSYGEIYAGGRHLATYSGATTNFLHADWLGTKRVMTSLAAANSETCTSLPFGDASTCTGTDWNFFHFTDDIHDSESNLEHTLFRQYSSTQGRWTTTDPYGGSMDLGNPQSLNRYAYVGNDPNDFTDPLGLEGGMPCSVDPFSNFAYPLCGPDQLAGAIGPGGGSSGCFDLGLGGFGFGFGSGCGISINLGGGFGGLPLPGCILPGACSLKLPWKSIADLLPKIPEPCLGFWCPPDELGNGFAANGRSCLYYPEDCKGKNLFGTSYCGSGPSQKGGAPNDQVPLSGKNRALDEACRAHDICYGNNHLSGGDNWNPFLSKKKTAALRACNQALCNAAVATGTTAGAAVRNYFSTVVAGSCGPTPSDPPIPH